MKNRPVLEVTVCLSTLFVLSGCSQSVVDLWDQLKVAEHMVQELEVELFDQNVRCMNEIKADALGRQIASLETVIERLVALADDLDSYALDRAIEQLRQRVSRLRDRLAELEPCDQNCTPDCAGLACGDNGCDGSCGTCTAGADCRAGECVCATWHHGDCHQGDVWWFDSCGNPERTRKECASGCQDGRCAGCTPQCSWAQCGDDGCGGDCGICTGGKLCDAGRCICWEYDYVDCHQGDVWYFDSCGSPGERAMTCGPDGCRAGECVGCIPDCNLEGNNKCGSDGCGGECGDCVGDFVCQDDGSCLCTLGDEPADCFDDLPSGCEPDDVLGTPCGDFTGDACSSPRFWAHYCAVALQSCQDSGHTGSMQCYNYRSHCCWACCFGNESEYCNDGTHSHSACSPSGLVWCECHSWNFFQAVEECCE